MRPPMSPEEVERIARRRASAKLGWYTHATVYVAVNVFLFLISSASGFGHRNWSIYPMLGWGLGLALHGISVFMLGRGSGLRERMIQKERERLQRERDGI